MNALTGKQKSHLRSLAMKKKPIFRIGKEGITPTLLSAIDDYVAKNELLKIAFSDASGTTPEELALALAGLDIAVVQTIGKNLVVYRMNPKLEHGIELPR
ncbi:MAG: YhbY family RNA-binding protein [Bacillus subtilis]|nr:YhbY family RNA-binding protein [Bacillus subtilis]